MAELEASERKLATERDILRKAAKYFAGERHPDSRALFAGGRGVIGYEFMA